MSNTWIAVAGSIAFAFALVLVWMAVLTVRDSDPERKALVRRIGALSLRSKARLAVSLVRDGRIPLAVRAIPPGLVLYLATPIDVIPDFIPVLGYLDDVLIVGLGISLLLRFAPREVVAEHVQRLELEGKEKKP